MKVGAAIFILFSASISPAVQAFVVNSRLASGGPPVVRLNAVGPNENDVSTTGRREMLGKLAGVFVVGIMKGSQPAVAADTAAAGRTIWNTGKSPIVPGQKPKDKGDVSGYVYSEAHYFFRRVMKQEKIHHVYDYYCDRTLSGSKNISIFCLMTISCFVPQL
jgi:hypothetical protein